MKKLYVIILVLSCVLVVNGQITNRCQIAQVGEIVEGHCQTHAYWNGSQLTMVSYCDTDVLISGPGGGSGCLVTRN